MKKQPPIGIEFYKNMIDKNAYYVDKTLLIKELLDSANKVTLFTRPRRFGKTLALSMIKTFFEIETDYDGNIINNRHYFDRMKIISAGEKYTFHIGKYPVIFMTLKSAKQPDFDMAYHMLKDQIKYEFDRHRYILKSNMLSKSEIEKFESIADGKADKADYASALKFLSDCLKKCTGQNSVILIDEYDVPLENAYFRGFYDEMIDFIRSLFESALKTNDSLEFAVITGCLRISRESIFTGLNNLKIVSILDESYAEYFGFTQKEVEEILEYYEIKNKKEEVKKWYDGYMFGNTEVYNPWSIINYAYDIKKENTNYPKPYWSNTSSNSIIKELVENADDVTKSEIEAVMAGDTIEKPVHEEITYGDIHNSQNNLWNFLFFTGYLKKVSSVGEGRNIYLTLKIPNEEVAYIYENTIHEWFNRRIKTYNLSELYNAIFNGEEEKISLFIKNVLVGSISYYDNAESFYHGLMVGLLSSLSGYSIASNKESGNGRPDIMLSPYDELKPAVIIELKRTDKYTQMETGCIEALKQIEDKHYDEELIDIGYQKIIKYGICFCRKSCMVKKNK